MPLGIPSPDELRASRRKLGLTQAQLAAMAGVSQPLIARIENGSVDPRLSTLRSIVDALNRAEREEVLLRDVMQAPVIAISPGDALGDAIRLMRSHNYSQLPVLEGSHPVGSLSERSVVHALSQSRSAAELAKRTVGDVMGPPFPMAAPDASLEHAYRLLEDHSAVIVMEKGELLGIVAKADLLNLLG